MPHSAYALRKWVARKGQNLHVIYSNTSAQQFPHEMEDVNMIFYKSFASTPEDDPKIMAYQNQLSAFSDIINSYIKLASDFEHHYSSIGFTRIVDISHEHLHAYFKQIIAESDIIQYWRNISLYYYFSPGILTDVFLEYLISPFCRKFSVQPIGPIPVRHLSQSHCNIKFEATGICSYDIEVAFTALDLSNSSYFLDTMREIQSYYLLSDHNLVTIINALAPQLADLCTFSG